jgi:hypothetical protein
MTTFYHRYTNYLLVPRRVGGSGANCLRPSSNDTASAQEMSVTLINDVLLQRVSPASSTHEKYQYISVNGNEVSQPVIVLL